MKNKSNKPHGSDTFYSTRGILILVIAVILFAIAALIGMYALGVINMPAFISNYFSDNEATNQEAENISPEAENELYKALPAGEYASALADMPLPKNYYRSYSITVSAGNKNSKTDYIAIVNDNDWWVQTYKNGVILTTAVCKDGALKLTDNASNSSVTTEAEGSISFKERCEVMPLYELVQLIKAVDSGKHVSYSGGISTYSLSFTQSRGTGENLFNFSFTCENGVSEEYIFSFESAKILSAVKTYGGETIYKMELTDSRNNLDDIDIDALFTLD